MSYGYIDSKLNKLKVLQSTRSRIFKCPEIRLTQCEINITSPILHNCEIVWITNQKKKKIKIEANTILILNNDTTIILYEPPKPLFEWFDFFDINVRCS